MPLIPVPDLASNGLAFETVAMVHPSGFREYDARWLYPRQINPLGLQALGMALGSLIHERGVRPEIVVGHDYRSYSSEVKFALCSGLVAAGVKVRDIGLALSPMAYFAQYALDVPCVAMVTASHNDNGWTGVKMGIERPFTFGPEEMARLKEITLAGASRARDGGGYAFEPDVARRYVAHLLDRPKLSRPLKVVAACGNGTAGAFAPDVLRGLGCEVIPLDAELDHSFPRHNPNPEDMAMLRAMRDAVVRQGADVGFGFDGDGDRCGVVDETGEAIFADKVGVLLARDLARVHDRPRFVVDVKSTGLFLTDPELVRLGARTDYWKTGHSYIKRRVSELGALAGFEKSGHYVFNAPIGLGYDDGLLAAIAICDMLDRNPGRTLAEMKRALPTTWASPTMSPYCPDDAKYDVVADVARELTARQARGEPFAGRPIRDIATVNGVRIICDDGAWGLVRASSNKPELVVVVESPTSEARLHEMFEALDGVIRRRPEVGAYNQTIRRREARPEAPAAGTLADGAR